MPATLLVGGTMVELLPEPRVVRGDLVLINREVGTFDSGIPTTSTIDVSGCVLFPGLVLAHTHLYSALAAGMPSAGAPPTSFREILERVWWRLDRAIDRESLAVSAQLAAIDAVRSGVTCLFDHHESPSFIDGSLDIIKDAVAEIGLRAVLGYGATDRHGVDAGRAGLRECERFVSAQATDPEIRGTISLHAPFTCGDELLAAAGDLAKRSGAWLHYHAAEGPDDQRAARERWNSELFPKLDTFGLVNEKTLIAHAVETSASEVELLAERGAFVAHQARSNMNNGVGYARGLVDLKNVALGTDGIDQDVLSELQAAFFRRREALGPTAWPDAVSMLSAGHRLASALFGKNFGSFAQGAPADVTVLSFDPPTPLDINSLGSHLVFGRATLSVRDVFVAGRAIMRNRKLVGIDEKSIHSRARELAPQLWSRMDS
jgi:putative selenium metabolism protein SsnA